MKLGEITVNGKQVSVFTPPHDEPDFPWVDVEELARAYLPRQKAREVVAKTRKFGGERRAYATARNGDRIVLIVCHAMAQGLVGLIDWLDGHRGEDVDGKAHREYCLALGRFTADKIHMSFDDIIHAYKNPGGEYLRGIEI